jgi:CRISPR type IV-associated protein Csf3
MQPLEITAYVAGSIALARPEDLALDGILAYQVLRRHFREAFYHLPDPKEVLYFARLPLEMRGKPGERMQHLQTGEIWIDASTKDSSPWYWSCSSAQIEVKGRDTQYWNKRFDTQAALSDHIDFGGKVQKILIEQGRYKAYHMPLPTLVCDRVRWYAYGDMEALADLLCDVASLGKKRKYGNGAVLRVTVIPTMEDYSEWKDGQLMRPLPVIGSWQDVTPLDLQYIAFRAPQWHPANQQMCMVKAVRNG